MQTKQTYSAFTFQCINSVLWKYVADFIFWRHRIAQIIGVLRTIAYARKKKKWVKRNDVGMRNSCW